MYKSGIKGCCTWGNGSEHRKRLQCRLGGREGAGGYAKGRSGGEAFSLKLLSLILPLTSWQRKTKTGQIRWSWPPFIIVWQFFSELSALHCTSIWWPAEQKRLSLKSQFEIETQWGEYWEWGKNFRERCLGLSGWSSGRRFPRPGTSMTPSGRILSSLPRFCSEITEKNGAFSLLNQSHWLLFDNIRSWQNIWWGKISQSTTPSMTLVIMWSSSIARR